MKKYELPDPMDDRLDELLSALEALESRSKFLVELSLDERCALPKMDEDRERFTRRALEIGKRYPMLLPPHTDVERLLKGMDLRNKAFGLFEKSNKVTERLDDTIIASGSEAYVAALSIMRSLSVQADRDPSLKEDLGQLQRLFEPWEDILK